MRVRRTLLIMSIVALCGLTAWMASALPPQQEDKSSASRDQADKVTGAKPPPFPDFGYLPSRKDYQGEHFHLRQDYPDTQPSKNDLPSFLAIPFHENDNGKDNWLKYLLAVRDYGFEGNIEANWVVQKNKKRRWYHAPWQHWDRNGREAINGLTREVSARPGQLGATQKETFQTYAVGYFNEFGGYTIGQVWHDPYNPDVSKARFPVGTVIFKLLFTQATPEQVPYLHPPVEWLAFAEISDANRTRTVQKLRLLQMDIMARDDRALQLNGTGWVFGTYCYNGKLANRNPYENLQPVGLQWGDDPKVTDDHVNQRPTETIRNPKLKETVINPSPDLPPQHLGWNGRLTGPADYSASSCMSCHSTAQYPVQAAMNPEFLKSRKMKRGDDEWMKWFRNLQCGQPFSKNSNTTDFSLQLAVGIHNFHKWKAEQGGKRARPIELKEQHEITRGID